MVFWQFFFQDPPIQHYHIGSKVTSQSKLQHFLRPYMSLWHTLPGMKKEFEWTNLICLRTNPKISLSSIGNCLQAVLHGVKKLVLKKY